MGIQSSYRQFWCMAEVNQAAFLLGFPLIDAVDDLHFGDEVSELTEHPEPPLRLLDAHGELVNQAQGGLRAEAVPGLHRS